MAIVYGRLLLIAFLSVPTCGDCFAADVCPWMTQGTATKLLAGNVKASIQAADDKHGVCIFSRADSSASYALEIAVGDKGAGACPIGSSQMKGIGNEANLCEVKLSSSDSIERVNGTVRNTFLTVTLTERGKVMSKDARHDILDQAAEQVAGNLF